MGKDNKPVYTSKGQPKYHHYPTDRNETHEITGSLLIEYMKAGMFDKKKKRPRKQLIIWDDVQSNKNDFHISGAENPLQWVYTEGRNKAITSIFICHDMHLSPPPVRTNSHDYILFELPEDEKKLLTSKIRDPGYNSKECWEIMDEKMKEFTNNGQNVFIHIPNHKNGIDKPFSFHTFNYELYNKHIEFANRENFFKSYQSK